MFQTWEYIAFLIIAQTDNIIDTVIKNGQCQTLVRLLDATDLKNTLASHGPFTLFAPNDDAFKKVSNDTLNDLLKPENKGKLTDILDYHLLSGSYTQASIKTMALPIQLETLSTEKFIADKSGDSVKINSAIVTTADIFATNGIIQSIER